MEGTGELTNRRARLWGTVAFGLLFLVMGAIDLYDGEYSTGVGFLLLGVALLAALLARSIAAGAAAGPQTTTSGSVQVAVAVVFALAFLALLLSVVERFSF
jgi:hypothetical protein